MGSTGSGRFSDYSGSSNQTSSGGNGGGGGSSGADRCHQAISCSLEEVAQCGYYISTNSVPIVGAHVSVQLHGRLFAVDVNGVSIGALPTSFNYLAACMADGISYVGVVTYSIATSSPVVNVDIVAQ